MTEERKAIIINPQNLTQKMRIELKALTVIAEELSNEAKKLMKEFDEVCEELEEGSTVENVFIRYHLDEYGVSEKMKGYDYLYRAVSMVVSNSKWIKSMHSIVYFEIAKAYQTTPKVVEDIIFETIQLAWDNIEQCQKEKMLGNQWKRRPSNREFIEFLADIIR